MELHYSQTLKAAFMALNGFYYLMELHYSQTERDVKITILWFYYLMELHYSQTFNNGGNYDFAVLLPYGITLFSNHLDNPLSTI